MKPVKVVRVLSYDPGETTGFADLLIHPGVGNVVVRKGLELVSLDHLLYSLHPRLYLPAEGSEHLFELQVLCEKITPNHPSFNPYPIEVMGMVRLMSHIVGLPLELQSPSMMEAARRRHPLREIRSQHVRDAAHHAIAWAYRMFKIKLEVTVDESVVKETRSKAARQQAAEDYLSQLQG